MRVDRVAAMARSDGRARATCMMVIGHLLVGAHTRTSGSMSLRSVVVMESAGDAVRCTKAHVCGSRPRRRGQWGREARRAWLRPACRHGFVWCTAGPPHVSAYNDEAEPRRVPTLPYTLYASTTMRGGPTRRCARPAKARSGCLPDGHWGPAPRGSHEGLREHVPAVGRRRGVDQQCGPLYEGTRPRLSTASSWPTGTGSASRVVGASSPAWFVCRTAGPPHVSAYNDEPEPRRVPTLPYTLDASTAMRGGPTRRCPGAERSGAIVHAFYIKTSTIRSPTCTRARSTT